VVRLRPGADAERWRLQRREVHADGDGLEREGEGHPVAEGVCHLVWLGVCETEGLGLGSAWCLRWLAVRDAVCVWLCEGLCADDASVWLGDAVTLGVPDCEGVVVGLPLCVCEFWSALASGLMSRLRTGLLDGGEGWLVDLAAQAPLSTHRQRRRLRLRRRLALRGARGLCARLGASRRRWARRLGRGERPGLALRAA